MSNSFASQSHQTKLIKA